MFKNFFRKDLQLRNKWWHRFFKVFFVLFVVCFFITVLAEDLPVRTRYIEVASLAERIPNKAVEISKLKKQGEIIDYAEPYPPNNYAIDYNDVFCSNNLADDVLLIMKKTDVDVLHLRELHGLNVVTISEFSNYIRKSNDKCLWVDSINNEYGNKIYFLEPNDIFNYKDYSFYKESSFKTIGHFLIIALIAVAFTAIASFLILVIYYKIILYIIYGKSRK